MNVIEHLRDLTHIIRTRSISVRTPSNWPAASLERASLQAWHEGGSIVIRVGRRRGLDRTQ
jgi:hypothetical protein